MLSVSCEEVFSTKPEDSGHETMPKTTSQEHENLFIDNLEFLKKTACFYLGVFVYFLITIPCLPKILLYSESK